MDLDSPQSAHSSSNPVSRWVESLKMGDEIAAQRLWEEYYRKLVRVAQHRVVSPDIDDEVVAASAFNSFCLAAMNGRFPQITDRHDLWQLLICITSQKAIDYRRSENAIKRGGQATFASDTALNEAIAPEPTPEFALIMMEEFDLLLHRLPDITLRRVAVWKMEGFTHQEIAEKLDCAVRTVNYKLDLIRKLLESRAET